MVAAQLGVQVLGITYVANYGAGIGKRALSHDEVIAAGKSAGPKVGKLLFDVVAALGKKA
jgi:purine-nucleoside phosphorylase